MLKALATLASLAIALAAGPGFAQPAAPRGPIAESRLPSLDGATGWINTEPLTAERLRGHVVLIEFWTFSCINCLRTLPYLKAWAEKYRAQGLVVLGVHAPEFRFEHQPAKLARAIQDLGITYPVAVDGDFSLWRAFGNRAWPAFYLVDAMGRVRHQQLGEGGYERTERMLQQLLVEAGQQGMKTDLVAPQAGGAMAPAAEAADPSPETYLGASRAERFAAPSRLTRGATHRDVEVQALQLHEWTLSGPWTVGAEQVSLSAPGGRLLFRFRGRDLHLVLGPAMAGARIRFRVRIDGQPPLADHGSDTDAQGAGVVDAHRLYQLVRQSGRSGSRLFEIEFLDPGVQAYAFTFG